MDNELLVTDGIHVKRGRFGYSITFPIKTADNAPFNISTYTAVNFSVWRDGESKTPFLVGVCSQPDDYTAKYLVKAGDFEELGKFYAEIELEKTDVSDATDTFLVEVGESTA